MGVYCLTMLLSVLTSITYVFADEGKSSPDSEEKEMSLNRAFLAKRNKQATNADPPILAKKFKLGPSHKAPAEGSKGKATIVVEDDTPLKAKTPPPPSVVKKVLPPPPLALLTPSILTLSAPNPAAQP